MELQMLKMIANMKIMATGEVLRGCKYVGINLLKG